MPLRRPAVPKAVRDTLQTAYDDLCRTIRPEDAHDFAKTSLNDVRRAVEAIEDQLAARQCLRNMRRLDPLFRGLDHYSKSVDILCNGTPFLPWIWSPITVILKVSSDFVEAFDVIIKSYAAIANSLGRFESFSHAFKDNQGVQLALSVFYADILQFHNHAYKFVRRRGEYIKLFS